MKKIEVGASKRDLRPVEWFISAEIVNDFDKKFGAYIPRLKVKMSDLSLQDRSQRTQALNRPHFVARLLDASLGETVTREFTMLTKPDGLGGAQGIFNADNGANNEFVSVYAYADEAALKADDKRIK